MYLLPTISISLTKNLQLEVMLSLLSLKTLKVTSLLIATLSDETERVILITGSDDEPSPTSSNAPSQEAIIRIKKL